MKLPRMLRLGQHFDAQTVADIPAEVERQLSKLKLGDVISPGETVAITAGSRGIANLAVIVRAIVDHVKGLQATPFIVPAMGSHGGGDARRQRRIIEEYGVTEDYLQAEIRASMDTVVVAQTAQGIPVHFDRHAYEADHVIVCNRVKPHTRFVGEIESGLHKMMLIGLGKHAGAELYHRAIEHYSFLEIIQSVAQVVLKKCHVVAGVAIVENALDDTGLIEAVAPADFFDREKALFKIAQDWLPQLPFPEVDLLIVDEIGKNISGTGMDTNVVGRKYNDHVSTDRDRVKVRGIFVRGLTEQTHGNACGIGMAEITNQRTIDAVDRQASAINALTAGHVTAAALPVAMPTDREAIEALLPSLTMGPPENAKVIQIRDTLHLSEMLVSEAYMNEIEGRESLEIVEEPGDMPFDDQGNLNPTFRRE